MELLNSKSKKEFITNFTKLINTRYDYSNPIDGYPFPWNDSSTTDYSYCYDVKHSRVLISNFGSKFFTHKAYCNAIDAHYNDVNSDDMNDHIKFTKIKPNFPNMSNIENINWGKGSGLIVVGSSGVIDNAVTVDNILKKVDKYCQIDFIKKNGEPRTIVTKYHDIVNMHNNTCLAVFDVVKDGHRMIIKDNIKKISFNDETYTFEV